VAGALAERATIVWPNDILIGGAKVAGILCEMSADQEHVAWAVVGIGINVRSAPALGDARWRAGSLAAAGDARSRAEVLIAVLAGLGEAYGAWMEDGGVAACADFARRDALRGAGVTVSVGEERVAGTCEGLDELGRLLVREGPATRALGAGEVTRVEGIGGA
jgi:BirA family biotin operon repressor/biotin-[acetyl-CoA-carboxylase] ligase